MKWSRKQILVLFAVAVSSFIATFLVSSLNISLPSIEKSLRLKAIELTWVITSLLLAQLIFMFPVGKWIDMYGDVKLFRLGLIVFVLFSCVTPFSTSGIGLISSLFIQGIGIAFIYTSGQALVVRKFPPENRGQVIGITVSAVYIGLSTGPFIGGVLTQHFGWQSIFYSTFLLGLISIIIAYRCIDNNDIAEKQEKQKTDWTGTLLFMAAFSAIVFGSSKTPMALGWTAMLGGIVLLCLFWQIESRKSNPILDTHLFRNNRLFTFSNLAALLNYTSTFCIIFFMSLFLQKIKGLSPQNSGMIIICQPITMAVFSPIVGKMSDKIQPRLLATIGMTMITVSLFILSFIAPTTPIWQIISILIWTGFGFSLFSSPNMSTIMGSVNKNQLGQAAGTTASMRLTGQIICMTIITLLIAFMFKGSSVDKVDNNLFIRLMRYGFIIFTIVVLPGIWLSFSRGDVNREVRDTQN